MRKVRAAICFSSLLLSGAEQTGGAEYGQQNGSAPYDSRKCRVVIGYHGRLFLNGGGSAVQAVGRRFQFGPSRRLFDRPLQSVGIGRSDPRERPGDQQRQECDRRKGLSGSPSAMLCEEMVTSGVPLPTLIPSVTFPRNETTPATVATATDSSPCAANTCPLVLITCWKGAGSTMLTFTPAASAFAFGRMISSLWAASAVSSCPAAVPW